VIAFPKSAVVRELPRREIIERRLPFGYWCEFLEPMPVRSHIAGDFDIPQGFLSNGASVPNALYWIIDDTHPDILYPAYGHDALYAVRGWIAGRRLTRQQCDAAMREMMLSIGSPLWKAEGVYYALRAGGAAAWNSKPI